MYCYKALRSAEEIQFNLTPDSSPTYMYALRRANESLTRLHGGEQSDSPSPPHYPLRVSTLQIFMVYL